MNFSDTLEDFYLEPFGLNVIHIHKVELEWYKTKSDFVFGVPLEHRATQSLPANEAFSTIVEMTINFLVGLFIKLSILGRKVSEFCDSSFGVKI